MSSGISHDSDTAANNRSGRAGRAARCDAISMDNGTKESAFWLFADASSNFFTNGHGALSLNAWPPPAVLNRLARQATIQSEGQRLGVSPR
jgi:hypothetical protein